MDQQSLGDIPWQVMAAASATALLVAWRLITRPGRRRRRRERWRALSPERREAIQREQRSRPQEGDGPAGDGGALQAPPAARLRAGREGVIP